MSIKPNIIVAGLCKNNASYLKKIFDNLDNIISIASETAFIFLENDSLDDTKNELEKWGKDKNNFRLITINDLDKVIPIRTVRLELLRNLYVEIIKKDDNLLNSCFFINNHMAHQKIYYDAINIPNGNYTGN